MNNTKKQGDYKFSWGPRKEARKILAGIALMLCAAYATYSFFYAQEIERSDVEIEKQVYKYRLRRATSGSAVFA